MQCAIYKSLKQEGSYLYLAAKDDFAAVPGALRAMLGGLEHVMDLELSSERKLAREDVGEVMRLLGEQGWFLQLGRRDDLAADWRGCAPQIGVG